MIDHIFAFAKAHWGTILAVYGVLAVIATIINRDLPRDEKGMVVPPTNWKSFLWRVLVDCVSLMPQPGKVGVLGPINPLPLPSFKSPFGKKDGGYALTGVMCIVGLAGLALACLLAGCAHSPTPVPTPSTQQYEQAFGKCMEAAGIQDATGLGAKVLQILETPGLTQNEITSRLEALGIPALGQGLQVVAFCAISSWTGVNPVAPGAKPTPAQAAVRVFMARHAHAPTARP